MSLNKSTASSSSSSSILRSRLESLTLAHPPWLDLPDHLTENILERLPLSDYVRFPSVCRKWLSIQQNHRRRRHAPSSPPMINLPWFIPSHEKWHQQETLSCYSPFEQTSYRIQLPDIAGGSDSDSYFCSSSLPNGWLVLSNGYSRYDFTLVNPISGEHIVLPEALSGLVMEYKVAMASPPNWAVFAITQDKWNKDMYLIRPDLRFWTELEYPDQGMRSDDVYFAATCAIFWSGKFYCFHLSRGLMVFNPLDRDLPVVQFLEMDQSQLPLLNSGWADAYFDSMELFLVESEGKMLLVVEFFEYDRNYDDRELAGFKVFEADFSNKRWVRVEILGADRVLFIYEKLAISLLASDVGVSGNCIYCPDPSVGEDPRPWKVFDLGTDRVTDATSLAYPPSSRDHVMFVPSIY